MCNIEKYIKKIKNMERNTILVFFVVLILLIIIISFTYKSHKKIVVKWPYSQEKQNLINDLVANSINSLSKYDCKKINDEQAKEYCYELKDIVNNNKDKTKYVEVKYCKRPDGRYYPNYFCNFGWEDDQIIYQLKTIAK